MVLPTASPLPLAPLLFAGDWHVDASAPMCEAGIRGGKTTVLRGLTIQNGDFGEAIGFGAPLASGKVPGTLSNPVTTVIR